MLEQTFIDDTVVQLKKLKDRTDKAIAQVTDDQFAATIDAEANSIALIMKHVAGNMRSRWTAFLTSDGEKPTRNRDSEFEAGAADTRPAVTDAWQRAWDLTLRTIASLQPADLHETVQIRGESMSVVEAIHRQMLHYAEHAGQIILLAKHHAGDRWQTLSIPKKRA